MDTENQGFIYSDNNCYFRSSDVRIFPSAFRGNFQAAKNNIGTEFMEIVFDPEARMNTEANFILPRATATKSSYILEYNPTQQKIKFILGGYYFEISNINYYLEELKDQYVGIKLRSINIQDLSRDDIEASYHKDTIRSTHLLDTWGSGADNILDEEVDDIYVFTGLNVIGGDLHAAERGASAQIKLFLATGQLNQQALLPNILHGAGVDSVALGLVDSLNVTGHGQTVVGQFNDNNKLSFFEVGVGNSATDRRNAIEVIPEINKPIAEVTVADIANAPRKTNIKTDTAITGNASVSGTLNVGGKITSAATESTDSSTTLVTKSYIDNLIGGINTSAPVVPSGGGGKYITGVSQAGAKISTTEQSFDAVVSSASTNNNAPTGKAVYDFVTTKIDGLDVENQGGVGQFIQQIKEVDGKIQATPISFKTVLDPTDANAGNTVPTVLAIYNYIESVKDGLTTDISTTVSGAIGNLQSSAGGAGSYIKEVKQANGVIESTPQSFDKSLSSKSTDNNAPTSKAVYSYIESAVKGVLKRTDIQDRTGKVVSGSLEYKLLNLIYPVGSIYMQQPANIPETGPACPIPIGKWELITSGTFLCAADNSSKGVGSYYLGATGGYADAVTITHSHNVSFTGESYTGVTVNDLSKDGWFRLRTMQSADSYTAPDTSGGVVYSNGQQGGSCASIDYNGKSKPQEIRINLSHGHTITDPKHSHSITIPNTGVSGTNRNLPPYRAVYMWRRRS
jgi:hypothetical protein